MPMVLKKGDPRTETPARQTDWSLMMKIAKRSKEQRDAEKDGGGSRRRPLAFMGTAHGPGKLQEAEPGANPFPAGSYQETWK